MATAATQALALERAVRAVAVARDALSEAGRDHLALRADILVEAVEDELAGAGSVLDADIDPPADDELDGDYDEPYPEPEY